MRAWQAKAYGYYKDTLQLVDLPREDVPDNAARVQVKASGVIFADLLSIAGMYQIQTPPPFTPGYEAAGEVVEAGSNSDLKPGDRIITADAWGAWAEEVFVENGNYFRVPDFMDDTDAAAFLINYQTAHFGLFQKAGLEPGQFLLVHGGGGGVGTAAIQLGKAHGAQVIATAGSDEKLDVCRKCGADHVINYVEGEFVGPVKEITNGSGAQVVFDPVGGEVFTKSTKCIAVDGTIVVIGFASGNIPNLQANHVLLKNYNVSGLFLGTYREHARDRIYAAQEELIGLYEQGVLKPVIYKEYAMEELPVALEAIEQRASYGKVIVRNSGL